MAQVTVQELQPMDFLDMQLQRMLQEDRVMQQSLLETGYGMFESFLSVTGSCIYVLWSKCLHTIGEHSYWMYRCIIH